VFGLGVFRHLEDKKLLLSQPLGDRKSLFKGREIQFESLIRDVRLSKARGGSIAGT
jgi:hypothetical protein